MSWIARVVLLFAFALAGCTRADQAHNGESGAGREGIATPPGSGVDAAGTARTAGVEQSSDAVVEPSAEGAAGQVAEASKTELKADLVFDSDGSPRIGGTTTLPDGTLSHATATWRTDGSEETLLVVVSDGAFTSPIMFAGERPDDGAIVTIR